MTMGDGVVSSGAPVSLDWEPIRVIRTTVAAIEIQKIETYLTETDNVQSSDKYLMHHSKRPAYLSSWARYQILRQAGFSHAQIMQAKLNSEFHHQQRLETRLLDRIEATERRVMELRQQIVVPHSASSQQKVARRVSWAPTVSV
eukprot:CAMPEP_0198110382 /NCGR_PEP_ID=MMETSP1442-20131203/2403_1 /TAXON_ID= /ORGANISM="Craspedostauros australis, Strain CCMP3328" /LENGTH=143 /DNA_ID=CAMNT_0043766407 /DNA_START=51 /DNA_END=482 /DNA_ORIENTATION=-